MYDLFLDKLNELYNIINTPIDRIFKTMAIDKYKKVLNIGKEKFSDTYMDLKEKQKIKENGVVYTPKEIANYIVDNVIFKEDIINNPYIKILDPSCGCGDIIIVCYEKLKNIYEENLEFINEVNRINLRKEDISKHIVKNNLYGFDIDEIALKILAIDLFEVSGCFYENNFKKQDFLLEKFSEKFNIIVGNPPYVGHKSIDKEYAKKLKVNFKEIYKDKGDISYCFFQQAINNLSKKGRLSFITSRYFIESPSGEELRKILKEVCSLYKIVDFYGIRPFKRIGVDPVIIFLTNEQNIQEEIQVIKPQKVSKKEESNFYKSLFLKQGECYKSFYINKNYLNNKGWILRDKKERDIISKIEEISFTHLYNICDSYQGIITGCDKAFVVDNETIIKENLEKDIIKPWIKSSYIDKKEVHIKDTYLIYSDLIKDTNEYPNIVKHIKTEKDKLSNRRECKKGVRKWYELQWGRKKEIFEKEKIVFPYKANRNKFSIDSKGCYFSADVYSLILKEGVPFTYRYLISLLNSKAYEFYFQSFAKKLGYNLYEYYPNNIMKLCIPTMGDKEELNEDDINTIFNFSEEEISIIEDNYEKGI
ncbi:DNA methyltransferase [Clostridium botulinum]|uniref:site-specific DNA-methyltransferase (adenine-specific) n=1 Tax=Clostridium botulinum TaxID=1491 RepID=A0A9Q1UVZ4_CLOBO|nr:TaqI-like C-terminal specificity domain-containing protein [Clostridium botulinum]KEH99939.1 DNA methyltransferase [Clostridium botulinum C/D str. Sp77]KOA72971.1 DNA methyltransferase [Clostridium botulinum]KOA81777.1 DNA methyltransferase [Clostridium botulinum]KOA82917.1 DNA methyltransferase [Clostridium botulinum]KOA83008.1 DNA methyltransferase [Clostridium botulinum]